MKTNYYVFDLDVKRFCRRAVRDDLSKGGIIGYEDSPYPICAFDSRDKATAAALAYGLKQDGYTVLSERIA